MRDTGVLIVWLAACAEHSVRPTSNLKENYQLELRTAEMSKGRYLLPPQ